MRQSIHGAAVAVLGLFIASCSASQTSSQEEVRTTNAALYSVNAPTTVTAGTPLTLAPTCPGHKLPDQCGSWAGVELSASTTVHPHRDDADERCLCRPIDFQIPVRLPVTLGSSGLGQAELQFRKANGHVISCIYLGNERIGLFGKTTGGDAYDLLACTDGSKGGANVSSDWFSLAVHSADPFKPQTRVELRLGAPDVVDGVVQEEIVYANDSRVPGAALHIPRGSAPANQEFTLSVLPSPAVGSTIANGGDSFTTTGFSLDVHATGVDAFTFTPVVGASCPRIDLPYSPSALTSAAGAGAEQRLTARQITDLTGLTTGANVLAQTRDVTVDTVNHIASFCVSHLSFYVTGVNNNDDKFSQVDYARVPTRSCTVSANCLTGEECLDGICYTNATNAKPTLIPGTQYLLRLVFLNVGASTWSASSLRLISMEPRPAAASPTPLASSPWFPTLTSAYTQTYGGSAVAQGGSAVFTVPVTSPVEEKDPTNYPFGGALDLCPSINFPLSYLSECFSWDPNTHVTTTDGTTSVGLVEVCDGIDNDGSNGPDDNVPGSGSSCPANDGCPGTYQCKAPNGPGPNGLTCVSGASPAHGQACGQCGGTFECDGQTCSVPTPANFGQSCGQCGGTFECDGQTCTVSTPPDLGQGCGQCGGTTQCGEICSVPTPSDFGQGCGQCGGATQCDESCSVATPSDFGTQRTITIPFSFGASAPFTQTFPPDMGWDFVSCTMVQTSGAGFGLLHPSSEGDCAADFSSGGLFGLDGGSFVVSLVEQRSCGPEAPPAPSCGPGDCGGSCPACGASDDCVNGKCVAKPSGGQCDCCASCLACESKNPNPGACDTCTSCKSSGCTCN